MLKEVNDILYGERQKLYGSFEESFSKAATIASIFCNKKLSKEDIVKVQIAVKIARESKLHKRDNLVDLVGYTVILDDLGGKK